MTEGVETGIDVGDVVSSERGVPEEAGRGSRINWRVVVFGIFTLAMAVVFRHSLVDLWHLSRGDETYSHMPLIPLVSAYLLFSARRRVASVAESALLPGVLILGLGVLLFLGGSSLFGTGVHKDTLSLNTLAGLVIWLGGFIALFGLHSFRIASFPLLFLLFLVPIPTALLSTIVDLLQRASAEIANSLFVLLGVPFIRNDFVFELPGLSVMVARECSGIRSSISLFITGILAAHLCLTSPWRRAILILSVFPITVFKNALRVITLSLLGAYVDQRILDSQLHRAGGIPFFVLALLLFGSVLWVLKRSEGKAGREKPECIPLPSENRLPAAACQDTLQPPPRASDAI